MEDIIIDLSSAATRRDIHDILMSSLNFPEHYGKNLDALYDCASEVLTGRRVNLTVSGIESLPEDIQGYGQKIISIFERISSEISAVPDNSLLVINK